MHIKNNVELKKNKELLRQRNAITIEGCPALHEIDIPNATRLTVINCPNFKEIKNARLLKKIKLTNCPKFSKLIYAPSLSTVISDGDCYTRTIETNFGRCKDIQIMNNTKLVSLNVQKSWRSLYVHNCDKLVTLLLPSTLQTIHVSSCKMLSQVSPLTSLTELRILSCPLFMGKTLKFKLSESVLKKLELDGLLYKELNSLQGLTHLKLYNIKTPIKIGSKMKNLKNLTLKNCPNHKVNDANFKFEYIE